MDQSFGFIEAKGGDTIKNSYKILVLLGIINIIAFVSIAYNTEIIGKTPCNYFNIPLFKLSGYSCTEQSGLIRTTLNPDAYNKIINLYGSTTQTFSGR